jgi:hypothetical protein
MSPKSKAKQMMGTTALKRLNGERPNLARATTGAVLAGGVTGVAVFRLLRHTED